MADDPNAYPVTIKLRQLSDDEATPEQQGKQVQDGLYRSNLAPDDTDELLKKSKNAAKEGSEEIVKAKYVIGCDGAHSWVRRQLGFEMEGEPTDFVWGVLDIIPITDFRRSHRSASDATKVQISGKTELIKDG